MNTKLRISIRWDDHTALWHALQSNFPVLPIFIFDPEILSQFPENDSRVHFIYNKLQELNKLVSIENRGIAQYYGTVESVFNHLLKEFDIQGVYTNEDYEPASIERDQMVSALLSVHNIPLYSFKDQLIFAKNEVCKPDGSPYVVYTPFMKKWKENYATQKPLVHPSDSELSKLLQMDSLPRVSMTEIELTTPTHQVESYNIDTEFLDTYALTRNTPSIKGSVLGPHLRFGTLSIRKLVRLAYASSKQEIFLNELIWREFFSSILWHFPHTITKSFKPAYDTIKWRNNPEEFKAWCEGKTGYPLVDAGMRELNKTGYMHNRVRMVVASFLCKHLLIDWRWGEAYFAEKLLDYEIASNIGNWQWVAGCGVDAAPYFRIFNPTEQLKKFDSDKKYIHKWVVDINEFTYPHPIVDHSFARERCLATYKEALSVI